MEPEENPLTIQAKLLGTSFWYQAGLYAASALLPPLNLFWTIKYLKSADPKAKKIGVISLIIMGVAIIIGAWLALAAIVAIAEFSRETEKWIGQF